MARSVGKIFADIWQDPDWVRLSASAQRTFLLVLTQAKVNLAGVIDLKLERWALMAADTTVADLEADLAELEEHRFLIVDRVTEEVLVRTFVKNDVAAGTFNQNTAKGVWSAWKAVESVPLREAIVHNIPEDVWAAKLLPHAPEQAARIRRSGPPPPPSPDHRPNHGSNSGTNHSPDQQSGPQPEPSIDLLPTPSTKAAATTDRTADTPTDPTSAAATQPAAAVDRDATIRHALGLLVDRAIARNPPTRNPAGHRKAVTAGIRTDHLNDALSWLDRDPDLTAPQLADLLDPPVITDRATDRAAERWSLPERCRTCNGTGIGRVERDPTTGECLPAPPCSSCGGTGAREARSA